MSSVHNHLRNSLRMSHETTKINLARLKASMSEEQWLEQVDGWESLLGVKMATLSPEEFQKGRSIVGPMYQHAFAVIKKGPRWSDPFFKSVIWTPDDKIKIIRRSILGRDIEALAFFIEHHLKLILESASDEQWLQLAAAQSRPPTAKQEARLMCHMLLEAGYEVSAKNKRGQTALMISLEHFNLELAEDLLAQGAKINDQDAQGYSLITYLLPAERHREERLFFHKRPTPLPAEQEKLDQLKREMLEEKQAFIKKLLDLGLDTSELSSQNLQKSAIMRGLKVSGGDTDPDTPIFIDLLVHQDQKEKRIWDQEADQNNVRGTVSKPAGVKRESLLDQALLIAAATANMNLVKSLVLQGADINTVGPIFEEARYYDDVKGVKGAQSWGLVHHMAHQGRCALIKEWITAPWAKGWKTDIQTELGDNVWHVLAHRLGNRYEHYIKAFLELLSVEGYVANIHQENHQGQTPLLVCLSNPPQVTLRKLSYSALNRHTTPPNPELLEGLFKKGASAEDINLEHEGALYQYLEHQRGKLLNILPTLDQLLEHGAAKHINTVTRSGKSLIDSLIEIQNPELLGRLLEHGLELFVPEEPLVTAISNEHHDRPSKDEPVKKSGWFSTLIQKCIQSLSSAPTLSSKVRPVTPVLTALEKLEASLEDKSAKNASIPNEFVLRFKEIYAIQKERYELLKSIEPHRSPEAVMGTDTSQNKKHLEEAKKSMSADEKIAGVLAMNDSEPKGNTEPEPVASKPTSRRRL